MQNLRIIFEAGAVSSSHFFRGHPQHSGEKSIALFPVKIIRTYIVPIQKMHLFLKCSEQTEFEKVANKLSCSYENFQFNLIRVNVIILTRFLRPC